MGEWKYCGQLRGLNAKKPRWKLWVKGILHKKEWEAEEKDSYHYEVLGGTHLSLATQSLHAKYPENQYFSGRMCRVYVGLSDEQVVNLGAMHQQSSMLQHDVSYREEVSQSLLKIKKY